MKKALLRNGRIYHFFNKSIAGYKIFESPENCRRFMRVLYYYNTNPKIGLSRHLALNKKGFTSSLLDPVEGSIVKFIAYKLMPTHYHLELKVLDENRAYHFLNNIGNSYTRYLNTKQKRKGPLWQSSFQAVLVKSSQQALHLSRYIHLNAVTAGLVEKPEDWEFSSYREYIDRETILKDIMTEITIKDSRKYKKFVENNIDYQKKLAKIKKLLLE